VNESDNESVRFDSVKLANYRVYRDAQFLFPRGDSYDLHIVVGHGGCGKTNLMNAMSWCLYGKERYLSPKSEGLPIDFRPLNGVATGPPRLVNAELRTSRHDLNSSVAILDTFTRSLGNGGSTFSHTQIREGEVTLTDDAESAARYVETLIPNQMKSYYFFDGEKIQDFLFGQATSNIETALSFLSRISLLENTVSHLVSMQTDLQREIGKNNPEMLSLVDQKESESEKLAGLRSQLVNQERQRESARQERDKFDQLLHSQGGAADLPDRQTRLEAQKGALEDRVRLAESKYRSALYRLTGHVFVQPAMGLFDDLVADKEEKHELPPPVEPSLIERILSGNMCICGAHLSEDVDKRQHLVTLLQQVKDVSDLGSAVGPIRQHVSFVEQMLETEPEQVLELRKSWTDLRKDLADTLRELSGVALELQQIDVDQIRRAQLHRQEQQVLYDKYVNEAAETKVNVELLEKHLVALEHQIDVAEGKQAVREGYKARLEIVSSAIDIAKEVLGKRTQMVRSYVSDQFGEAFQDMMWQKDLYPRAFLDDSYTIHVLHASGAEALATMAESEKEVAAIAFILALHEVSGYQGPLVVDFPFGRTTDKMTDQIAEVLRSLSQSRQVILLMTDTEYSTTQAILHPSLASMHRLVRRRGETVVEVDA
jgi:DNA sulfur modification protein DndD